MSTQDFGIYCKIGNFCEGLFSRNGEITVSFTDIGSHALVANF